MSSEHTPRLTKFGVIEVVDGDLCFHDFVIDCDGATVPDVSSLMTELAIGYMVRELLQGSVTERDILRSQNAELVKALNELLYGTDCYLDTESRSVFHFTTEQLAQARSALAKAKP